MLLPQVAVVVAHFLLSLLVVQEDVAKASEITVFAPDEQWAHDVANTAAATATILRLDLLHRYFI